MKKSFKENEKEEIVVDETALAEVTGGGAVATQQDTTVFKLGQVSGEMDRRDVQPPRLSLVQGVGPLSADHEPGTWVLQSAASTIELAPKNSAFVVHVLSIAKQWEESLPYDPNGPIPRKFNSKEEVIAAGFWTDWRNDERPPVHPMANLTLLIEQPAGVDNPAFSLSIQDKKYAMALYTVRNTAYGSIAKPVFTASASDLRDVGIHLGEWEMVSDRVQRGGNWIFLPIIHLIGIKDGEFKTALEARFGG